MVVGCSGCASRGFVDVYCSCHEEGNKLLVFKMKSPRCEGVQQVVDF